MTLVIQQFSDSQKLRGLSPWTGFRKGMVYIYMKNSRYVVCLSVAVVLMVASLGCASGSSPVPLAGVGPTSNPMVAQYTIQYFHSGLSAWVEFGTDTTYGRQTSVMSDSTATPGKRTLNILVAGMKPLTTYHMRAHVNWTGGSWVDDDQTFTTGAPPPSQTSPQFAVTPPAPGVTPAPGVELINLVGAPLSSVALDLQGNIIWYCPQNTVPIKLMQNGHFIMNTTTDLLEVDLACDTIRDVSVTQVNQSLQANGFPFTIPPPLGVPGGGPFHHDVLVLPNGHWIALCEVAQSFTDLTGYPGTTQVVGDALVDIDLNGNVGWAWSSFDHLDVNRHPYFGLPDWTHSNAVVYTPDGNLLLSMRAQSWILKIDYANGTGSGNVLWKLGKDGDFSLSGGDPNQWFYSQHYPSLVSTTESPMELAIMDNGDYRTDSTGVQCATTSTSPPCYSRATVFQVDESTNLASVFWEDLPGFYSFWGGSIESLSNGNVEYDMTTVSGAQASQITEATQTPTPQTVWQLTITGANAYRGYRIPSLYPGVTWEH